VLLRHNARFGIFLAEVILMRILFIGGTNMTGPFAVRDLVESGHDVWLLHRSPSESPLLRGAMQIKADKADLFNLRSQLETLHLDIAVNMVAFTRSDATTFLSAISGIVPRAVVISSIDVYRAYGRLHRTEPGIPDEVPLDERAPLRAKLSIEGEAYDKIAVEQIAQSDPKLPCTVLRYPAVYGPGDRSHRLYGWVRRMDDHRPFILMGKEQAAWRFTHGYVENVALALVLAISMPAAAGQTYNVGELSPMPWARWVETVGRVAGWNGRVSTIPDNCLPPHLSENVDFRQDWIVNTSRIRLELGYMERVGPEDCLLRTIEWERNSQMTPHPKDFDYVAEDAAHSAFSSLR
jgi:nucleoside-diphosphate-sugar epimerase